MSSRSPARPTDARFTATRWSVVLASHGGGPALQELMRAYWFPLYAYLRRRGSAPEEAEDLVQGFLASLLQRQDLADVRPEKGKFRSFLLAALSHYAANARDRDHALRRGGGVQVVSLDGMSAEARYALEPADAMTAERVFERQWALAVLAAAVQQVREAYAAAGKEPLFEALKGVLTARETGYEEIGQRLGMEAGAVKVAAHRLRKRYREALRDVIAGTLAQGEDVQEEITELMKCL